jgi:hypothetical protein
MLALIQFKFLFRMQYGGMGVKSWGMGVKS